MSRSENVELPRRNSKRGSPSAAASCIPVDDVVQSTGSNLQLGLSSLDVERKHVEKGYNDFDVAEEVSREVWYCLGGRAANSRPFLIT